MSKTHFCIFPFSSIDRQPFMLTFTPMVSLEVSFNLTKCMFWDCGGSHSTQRQITQPVSWWLQTQDCLAVRQQTSQLMTWTCWGNNDHTNTICFMCIRLPPSHIFSLVDFFFPSSTMRFGSHQDGLQFVWGCDTTAANVQLSTYLSNAKVVALIAAHPYGFSV